MRCSIKRVWLSRSSSAQRARALGLSAPTCLGRHTLSGLLCTAGQQFRDWSAAYRLFERERLDPQALWRVPLNGVLETLPPAPWWPCWMTRCSASAGTASPVPLGAAIHGHHILPIISSAPVASCRFPWLCPSIPPRPPVRPALSPSICGTLLRRANPRAARMSSSGKAGVRSQRLPPSAAAAPNASLLCGTPSIKFPAELHAPCWFVPTPPSPTARCCAICLRAPPSSVASAKTLAFMPFPPPKRKTTDGAAAVATASVGS